MTNRKDQLLSWGLLLAAFALSMNAAVKIAELPAQVVINAVKLTLNPDTLSAPQNICTPSTILITYGPGMPLPVIGERILNVERGGADITFYTDSGCTREASSFTIHSGVAYTFYLVGSAVGTFPITVHTDGLEVAMQTVTVTPYTSAEPFQSTDAIAPAHASSSGYNKLVFADEFDSDSTISPSGSGAYNWYTSNFYDTLATLPSSGYKVHDGYLTILTDNSGYSYGIATASPSWASGVWRYGYFEARIRFDPKGHKGGAWPAFWLYSLESALNSIPLGGYFGELDFMECYPRKSPCTYTTTLHEWQHNSSGNGSLVQNTNNAPAVPRSFDFAQWHVFACLWTRSEVQWYLDDKLMATVAVGAGTAFSALEKSHMFLILGTGKDWPMDVDYVHVWQ